MGPQQRGVSIGWEVHRFENHAKVRPGASCPNTVGQDGLYRYHHKPGMYHVKQSGTAEPPSLMHFREEVF